MKPEIVSWNWRNTNLPLLWNMTTDGLNRIKQTCRLNYLERWAKSNVENVTTGKHLSQTNGAKYGIIILWNTWNKHLHRWSQCDELIAVVWLHLYNNVDRCFVWRVSFHRQQPLDVYCMDVYLSLNSCFLHLINSKQLHCKCQTRKHASNIALSDSAKDISIFWTVWARITSVTDGRMDTQIANSNSAFT